MEFRLLGPFEVVHGGVRVDLGSRKQRAVLALLALHANRVVSVERLIDELWGQEPPARAIASLQAYVSNLRRVLEPDRPPREAPRLLVTQSPGYVLRLAADALDVARFEAAAAEGRRLLDEGRPAQARALLADSLHLWRGPVLADFAFEAFVQAEAARLQELRLAALEDRLQADLDLGAHATAAVELEALLAQHPLRERLWGLLMLAQYRAGRQAEALRAYQRARQALRQELNVEPAPVLRRLESDILAQVPSLDWNPARDSSAPPAPAQVVEPTSPQRDPIVGRDDELAELQAAVARAGEGRGGAVLVQGEPGIGKTCLLEELATRARSEGLAVAWGGSVEGGGTPAYWPWVEVIRSLLGGRYRDEARTAVGPAAAVLAQVLPEVKELVDVEVPPPALDPETGRLRLFEAATGFLTRLSRARPVLVVLDDLQWADVATCQLLSFLAPGLRDSRLVVVASYRQGEVPAGHPLRETLAILGRHQVAERLQLHGLAETEVGLLMEATTGLHLPPAVVTTVRARTEGNPFFVTELARLLLGDPRPDSPRFVQSVPGGVRDVVRHRLRRLPEQAMAVLGVAAVIGRDFDLEVLEAAADLGPERTLELVEAALLTGVVVEHPDVVGRFRFSHDLVRETILEEINALRRARVHARVGEAMEARHGDDESRAIELAQHFFFAAPVTGAERALAHGIRAADVATSRLAHEQAEEQLRRARELLARLPPGRERDRQEIDVLLRMSLVLTMTKGHANPEIGQLLDRARQMASRLGDTESIPRALFGLMLFYVVAARYASARRFASQLLEVAHDSGRPADLVAAHVAMGTTACHEGELEEARDHLEAALALPEGLHDPALAAWLPLHPFIGASCFLAWAVWELGDRERAAQLVEDGLEFANGLAHDLTIAHAYDAAARIAVLDRDPERAKRRSEKALQLRERQGSPLYAAIHAVHHGWARAQLGDPEAGVAELQAGLAGMEATGAQMLHTLFLALLAEAQWRAGRRAEALTSVERGLEFVERTGERFWEAELHRLRGELLVLGAPERRPEAICELERALEIARRQRARSLEERAAESLQRFRAVPSQPPPFSPSAGALT